MKGLHPSPATGIIPPRTLSGKVRGDVATIDFPRMEAASTPEARENLRVTAEVLDELYFKPTFYAGDGFFTAGVNLACGTVPGCSTVEMLNGGAAAFWRIERTRRARWQNAAVRVTIRYTATVGTKDAFHVDLRTREHGPGDLLPTTSILVAGLTLGGALVANTEMVLVYVSPAAAIYGAKASVTFSLSRDPTAVDDVNVNSLHILSMEWEVIPL